MPYNPACRTQTPNHFFNPPVSTMCLAIPGKVESLFSDPHDMLMGKVSFGGVVKDVCLAYLPDIQINDYVLVHVGFAISQVNEQTAQETMRLFEELGLLAEGLDELRETDFENSSSNRPPPA